MNPCVVRLPKFTSAHPGNSDITFCSEAHALQTLLEALPADPGDDGFPYFLVTFDDAHIIVGESRGADKWSVLRSLQNVIAQAYDVWAFFFFISLSTTVYQSKPQNIPCFDPVTVTPFDQFVLRLDEYTGQPDWDALSGLEKVTSIRYMAHLGRPMYVPSS